MYQIELRRQAYKDLESISADYARLIAQHIDSFEENPVLMTQRSSKVTRVFRCGLALIAFCMTLTIKLKS